MLHQFGALALLSEVGQSGGYGFAYHRRDGAFHAKQSANAEHAKACHVALSGATRL